MTTLTESVVILQQSIGDKVVRYAEYLYDIVEANLLISVIAGFLLFGAGVITTHYVVRFFETESDRFLNVIEDCDKITVLMHNNPDPDAMACALAVDRLAQDCGVSSEIVYPGRIAHDENRAFRAVLNVEFKQIDHAREIEGDKVVLVDQFEPRGVKDGETIVPSAVIDHHDPNGKYPSNIEFCDIRENVGACSSILSGYLQDQDLLDAEPERNRVSSDLATALYHGIKSDTDDISQSVSDLDFASINLLYQNIDEEKLYRISNPKVDGNSLETKARSIMGRDVRGPFAVSDVGDVQNTDSIPQAADELIRLEGVSAAVVMGLCNESIRLSGRAYDDRIHLGQALQRAVEEITSEGGAGGHADMAGGEIPKDALENSEHSRSDLVEKVFDVMDGR